MSHTCHCPCALLRPFPHLNDPAFFQIWQKHCLCIFKAQFKSCFLSEAFLVSVTASRLLGSKHTQTNVSAHTLSADNGLLQSWPLAFHVFPTKTGGQLRAGAELYLVQRTMLSTKSAHSITHSRCLINVVPFSPSIVPFLYPCLRQHNHLRLMLQGSTDFHSIGQYD